MHFSGARDGIVSMTSTLPCCIPRLSGLGFFEKSATFADAMIRYFVQVAYQGTAFNGSQIQGLQPTVQGHLNQALSTLLRTSVGTYGASRTDEGVHAYSNFYHFDFEEELNLDDVLYRLNAILPKEIAIASIRKPVNPESNCRFDAQSRRYRYRIHFKKNPFLNERSFYFPFQIHTEILAETAAILLEYRDFATFCKRNSQSFTSICRIDKSIWHVTADGLEYEVEANRFLRGMVRALVGTQLQVARGRYDLAEFRRRIDAKDCTLADFSVPGHGLYLEKINYPPGYFL